MVKLSFSDAIGIVGIILMVVFIVLDKAGKLKGPILLVLLAGCAIMTLPLVLSMSFVSDPHSGIARFSRGMLMVFAVGLIYAVIAVWITNEPIEIAEGSKTPNDSQLTIEQKDKSQSDLEVRQASKRQFTDRTPKELLAFYKDISPLQADDLMKPFKGLWMTIQGQAKINPVDAGYGTSQVIVQTADGADCACTFAPQWREDIKRIRINDQISAQGKISEGQGGTALYLLDWDLLNLNAPLTQVAYDTEHKLQKHATKSTGKPIEPKTTGQQQQPLVGEGATVTQDSSNAVNSPNVIGNNNQFNFGTGTSYDFNGAKRSFASGVMRVVTGEEFSAFQQMVSLEQDKKWQELVNLSDSWIKKNPRWLGSYVLASEGYFYLGNQQRAIELLEYVDSHAPAEDTNYDNARKNLQMLKNGR